MLAHITLEKITGLKGDVEGVFYVNGEIKPELPLVFNSFLQADSTFVFTHNEQYVYLRPVETISTLNYLEHFYYGVNFLIKEITYGGGAERHSTGAD